MEESKKRVYVLDDDEGILSIAKRILDKSGFEVRTSSRAIGTTNDIKEFSPHVLLVDVMMPALKGTKVVEIVRKLLDPIPIIILYSNKSADELRELSIESGADDYLCKTEGPQALLRKVRMHTL